MPVKIDKNFGFLKLVHKAESGEDININSITLRSFAIEQNKQIFKFFWPAFGEFFYADLDQVSRSHFLRKLVHLFVCVI